MTSERSERVFISYSHDSPLHQERVLALANQLRQEGVDAWIDRYEPHPAEGWPRWMKRQIDGAVFVLAVCTETYCRRFEGDEKPGQGLGVSLEGLLATQILYQAGGLNKKVVPVLFEGADEVVPTLLKPYTRYHLPEDYENLYRHLTSQPEVVPLLLGDRREQPATRTLGETSRTGLRAMPVSGSGAPEPTKLDSPFIVGPPAEKPEHFYGRDRELEEIRHALGLLQATQIVGETRMGKTSLLGRVLALVPKDRPVARINAQSSAGHSPKDLVLAIADSLSRRREIDRVASDGQPDSLLTGLDGLMPCTVLVDEADALAQEGHGFDRDFFDHCRTLCQDRKLIWLSASRSDLEKLFAKSGLTSRFLNDSKRVWVGQLDSVAADALVSVLPASLATRARQEAGRFAMGLQWLGHELWQHGDRSLLAEDFANAMQIPFTQWWERLDQEDRRLLKRSGAGVAIASLGDKERRKLATLVQRGLAEKEDNGFQLPGAAWRSFVADAE